MKKLLFKTELENAEFYVASLAIGILEGMKSQTIPLEMGIWSLGRPVFWEELKKNNVISQKLIDLVSIMDEFDALQTLGVDVSTAIEETLKLLRICQKKALAHEPNLVIESIVE